MSSLSSSAGFELESKSTEIPRRVAIGAAAAGFGCFINMWCTQPILPVLADSLHVRLAATNNTVTAPLVATALIAPFCGALSDRFGRKIFISGAAFLLVFPTLLCAMSDSLHWLTIFRFIQGMMLPFIFTVTIAYIADEFPGPTATRLAGIYMSGTISGGLAGRLVSGYVAEFFGWRAAFYAVGLISLAVALVVFFLLPREKHFRPLAGWGQTLRSFPRHLSNPKLLGNYVIGFGVLFSLVCVFTYLNFRLAGPPFSLGPAMLGSIFIVYLGGVAISPITGRIAAAYGRRPVMLTAFLACMAGLALSLSPYLPVILIGVLLVCCGIFAQQTVATGFTGIAARTAKSTAAGLYVTFYYIGGSCGGTLPDHAWHHYGWAGCAAITAAVQAIMLATATIVYRRRMVT
jgi:predicted MFS family arabinose efflux permease